MTIVQRTSLASSFILQSHLMHTDPRRNEFIACFLPVLFPKGMIASQQLQRKIRHDVLEIMKDSHYSATQPRQIYRYSCFAFWLPISASPCNGSCTAFSDWTIRQYPG